MSARQHTSLRGLLARITDPAGRRLAYRWWWYAASVALVLLVGAGYLTNRHCSPSARCDSCAGYPLDDAWIHQCYARTLAQTGQFAFAPGRPSTGSTAPLWTLLLAMGYLLRLPPVPWSYGLGALAWLLTAWTAQRLARRLFPAPVTPAPRTAVPWVALACLLEWHLAWAAFSGMEITLFCFLSLLLLERCAARARPAWLGLLGGLLALVRPEGLVLAAGVLLVALVEPRGSGADRRPVLARLTALLAFLAGLAVALAPAVALYLSISGQPFPSTLYAKQAEYRALLDQPLWRRLWRVTRRPLVGAQVLLIPGFLWQAALALRRQVHALARAPGTASQGASPSPLAVLLPLAWWALYHVLYALRLPVDYQHGRYLVPALPILLLYGTTGTVAGIQRAAQGRSGRRLVTRVWTRALAGALGVLALAFLVLGSQAYAEDRCVIQQEMVDVALWVRDQTPPGALIAAHDIGALGYWSQRPLLDLAGLIDPEVVPFMRDESRLLDYVLERRAAYLVAFPSWYPSMAGDHRLSPVYQAAGQAPPPPSQDHMTVYRIR